MKTNTDFKNDALDALRGNWGKAVIATLLYALVTVAIIAPVEYTSLKVQGYMTEQVGGYMYSNPTAAVSLIQDPEYQSLQRQNYGATTLTFLLEVFLLFPVMLGFYNAFRKLLVNKDTEIVQNTLCQ